MRDDLERLAESCRRWSREPSATAQLDSSDWRSTSRGDRVEPSPSTDRSNDQDDTGPGGRPAAAPPGAPGRTPVAPGARRVAGKTAGPADANALRPPVRRDPGKHGARLDPGPLRADRGPGRARANLAVRALGPASTSSSPGRTWPICSVFLFEFALKLALAPNRMTYFAPPLRDRPGRLAPVRVLRFIRSPWNNWRTPRRGAGPPSGPFRPLLRARRGSLSGSSGWPCRSPGWRACRSSS